MWPFNKKEPKVERYKLIDWTKVKTTEDIVMVLKNVGLTSEVRVPVSCWDNTEYNHMLTDDIYQRREGEFTLTKEEPKDNT
jgi:hypothetical protein